MSLLLYFSANIFTGPWLLSKKNKTTNNETKDNAHAIFIKVLEEMNELAASHLNQDNKKVVKNAVARGLISFLM